MTALLDEFGDRGRTVLLEGDAGIGRTRLLAGYAAEARRRGIRVLAGRATTAERTMYGLLLDALADAECKVCSSLAALLTRPGEADSTERLWTYRSARALLAAAVPPGGAVLLLDDVHLADDASAGLIGHLLRHPPEAPLVTVFTARTGRLPHQLAEALARIDPQPLHLLLGPLPPAEVEKRLTGHTPARRRMIMRLGAGNPLHLDILGRLSTADLDRLTDGERPAEELPAIPRRTIEADLQTLDTGEREVLQAAAVLGRLRTIGAIAHVADQTLARTGAAVDRMAHLDLVRQEGSRLVFRHPLIRAAAYQLTGPAWRAAAHARAADFLRAHGARPALIAPHLAATVTPGDVMAVRLLADAADEVLPTAPSTGAGWLYTALEALPDRAELAALRTRVRLRYAEALSLAGRLDETRSLLRELTDEGLTEREVVVSRLATVHRLLGQHDRARRLLTRELAVPRRAPDATIHLTLELAVNDLHDGDWPAASSQARSVLAEATEHAGGLPAAARTVLAAGVLADGRLDEAREEIAAAAACIDSTDDLDLRDDLGVFATLAWTEHFIGRDRDALRHVERGLQIANRYGRRHLRPHLLTARALVRTGHGEVGEALHDAIEAQDLAREQGNPECESLAGAVGSVPLLWRCGPTAVVAAKEGTTAAPRSLLYRALADLHTAETNLAIGTDHPAAEPGITRGPIGARGIALRVAAGLAQSPTAQLDRARHLAGDVAAQLGFVDLVEATTALRNGTGAAAITHAQAAVAHFGQAGDPIRQAQARMRLGQAYAATGDTAEARQELGEAKRTFTHCGADWLAEQAGLVQRRIAARLPRSVTGDLLSRRERQVAELVARGLTNQQIGRQLVVSPRTVECHVSRIMTKLKVPNRAAFGAYLQTTGEGSADSDGPAA